MDNEFHSKLDSTLSENKPKNNVKHFEYNKMQVKIQNEIQFSNFSQKSIKLLIDAIVLKKALSLFFQTEIFRKRENYSEKAESDRLKTLVFTSEKSLVLPRGEFNDFTILLSKRIKVTRVIN